MKLIGAGDALSPNGSRFRFAASRASILLSNYASKGGN